MPALVLFGRLWSIGTDDFVVPSSLDSVIRLAWMLATITVYFVDVQNLKNCYGGKYVKLYFYGHFVLIPFIFALDVWLNCVSSSGGVMDIQIRRRVPLILYLRILGELVSSGWNICGIFWFWNDPFGCSGIPNISLRKRIRCFVVMNMMPAFFIALCWISIFDPLGREYLKIKPLDDIESGISELPDTRRSRYWERRLRVYYWGFPLPCLQSKETREGFKELGKILAYFTQDNDFVMTDFLVGLIHLPKFRLDTQEFECDQFSSPTESRVSRSEILLLYHLHRYIKITYGRCGLRQIWKQLRFCAKVRPRPDGLTVEGDNWLGSQTACLMQLINTRFKDVDLIYASFCNDYYQTPFCLTVDHHYKSYVIAFRGSVSANDLITCMTAWPVPIGIPGLPDTFLVHHGFLMTAKNAKQKLQKYLEKLRSVFPDYRLVLTGYSLGGAVASVLGLMLKPEFPDIRVYAFSPPGGIFNLEASIWARSFITTMVHPGDLIPRLSLNSVENYVSYVIKAIRAFKTPKYTVFLEATKSSRCFEKLDGWKKRIILMIVLKLLTWTLKLVQLWRKLLCCSRNGFEIDEPDPEFTGLPRQTQGSLPIMYLPGKVLEVDESSSEQDDIFKIVNPASYLRISTFTSIIEQFFEHLDSTSHDKSAFHRFRELGRRKSEPIPKDDTAASAHDNMTPGQRIYINGSKSAPCLRGSQTHVDVNAIGV